MLYFATEWRVAGVISRRTRALHICAYLWARSLILDFLGSLRQEGFATSLAEEQTVEGVGQFLPVGGMLPPGLLFIPTKIFAEKLR